MERGPRRGLDLHSAAKRPGRARSPGAGGPNEGNAARGSSVPSCAMPCETALRGSGGGYGDRRLDQIGPDRIFYYADGFSCYWGGSRCNGGVARWTTC